MGRGDMICSSHAQFTTLRAHLASSAPSLLHHKSKISPERNPTSKRKKSLFIPPHETHALLYPTEEHQPLKAPKEKCKHGTKAAKTKAHKSSAYAALTHAGAGPPLRQDRDRRRTATAPTARGISPEATRWRWSGLVTRAGWIRWR